MSEEQVQHHYETHHDQVFRTELIERNVFKSEEWPSDVTQQRFIALAMCRNLGLVFSFKETKKMYDNALEIIKFVNEGIVPDE